MNVTLSRENSRDAIEVNGFYATGLEKTDETLQVVKEKLAELGIDFAGDANITANTIFHLFNTTKSRIAFLVALAELEKGDSKKAFSISRVPMFVATSTGIGDLSDLVWSTDKNSEAKKEAGKTPEQAPKGDANPAEETPKGDEAPKGDANPAEETPKGDEAGKTDANPAEETPKGDEAGKTDAPEAGKDSKVSTKPNDKKGK